MKYLKPIFESNDTDGIPESKTSSYLIEGPAEKKFRKKNNFPTNFPIIHIFEYETRKWKDVKVGELISDGLEHTTEVSEKLDDTHIRIKWTTGIYDGIRTIPGYKVGEIIEDKDLNSSGGSSEVQVITNFDENRK